MSYWCMTDRKEIGRLFKEHYLRLWRLAVAMLHDPEAARDVVHDLFAAVLDSRGTVPLSDAYLMAGVRNRCLNFIRSRDIHERVVANYLLETDRYDIEEWPDEDVMARIRAIIHEELPPQCRRVTLMRFSGGLAPTEIARECGISVRAVYKHLGHALTLIRKNLKHHG